MRTFYVWVASPRFGPSRFSDKSHGQSAPGRRRRGKRGRYSSRPPGVLERRRRGCAHKIANISNLLAIGASSCTHARVHARER